MGPKYITFGDNYMIFFLYIPIRWYSFLSSYVERVLRAERVHSLRYLGRVLVVDAILSGEHSYASVFNTWNWKSRKFIQTPGFNLLTFPRRARCGQERRISLSVRTWLSDPKSFKALETAFWYRPIYFWVNIRYNTTTPIFVFNFFHSENSLLIVCFIWLHCGREPVPSAVAA